MKRQTRPLPLPLRDELTAAIALLRARRLLRAANRLEALSQDILHPQPRQSKRRTRAVTLVLGSGRTVKAKLDARLLDRAAPPEE